MKQVILLVISLIVNPAFGEFLPPTKIFEVDGTSANPLAVYVTAPQEQAPFYKDGVLNVPRVDIDGQQGTGIFQDGIFALTEQGTWHLVDFKTSGVNITRLILGSVKTIITDSFPTQVFLKVMGISNRSGINATVKVFQRLIGNSFEISVYNSVDKNNPDASLSKIETYAPMSILSAADLEWMRSSFGFDDTLVNIVSVIPLPVYGLKTGTYQYNLYDGYNSLVGTFELKKDNRF